MVILIRSILDFALSYTHTQYYPHAYNTQLEITKYVDTNIKAITPFSLELIYSMAA